MKRCVSMLFQGQWNRCSNRCKAPRYSQSDMVKKLFVVLAAADF